MVKKDGMILEKQHCSAVTSSLFGQERGLGEMWIPPWKEELGGSKNLRYNIYSYKLSIHFLPLFVKADQR